MSKKEKNYDVVYENKLFEFCRSCAKAKECKNSKNAKSGEFLFKYCVDKTEVIKYKKVKE